MRCVDVNVLVYAHRADLPEHAAYRDLLGTLANDEEPLGLADVVLSGFLRVITNRRVFASPTPAADAWERVDELLAAPAATPLHPGRRHWEVFRRLAEQIEARGNDVTDAYLAAYAVDNGATWLSADRGFARFREVRWEHPLGA
jgi:toxin-antitoxin system PIN domain toxin